MKKEWQEKRDEAKRVEHDKEDERHEAAQKARHAEHEAEKAERAKEKHKKVDVLLYALHEIAGQQTGVTSDEAEDMKRTARNAIAKYEGDDK
jgi:hypothetical protein